MSNTAPEHQGEARRERIERAIESQKAYIARVPDPDNRCRAEANLLTLLEMRECGTSLSFATIG